MSTTAVKCIVVQEQGAECHCFALHIWLVLILCVSTKKPSYSASKFHLQSVLISRNVQRLVSPLSYPASIIWEGGLSKMLSCMSCPGPLRTTAGEVRNRNLNAAANTWHSCSWCWTEACKRWHRTTQHERRDAAVTRHARTVIPDRIRESELAEKSTPRLIRKAVLLFRAREKVPKERKKNLARESEDPPAARSPWQRCPVPGRRTRPRPRQLLGDGRADPEMRDWGGDAVRYCVLRGVAVVPALRGERPRVGHPHRKPAAGIVVPTQASGARPDTDRQPCVPAVSRARTSCVVNVSTLLGALHHPERWKRKKEKRDYSTMIARPVWFYRRIGRYICFICAMRQSERARFHRRNTERLVVVAIATAKMSALRPNESWHIVVKVFLLSLYEGNETDPTDLLAEKLATRVIRHRFINPHTLP